MVETELVVMLVAHNPVTNVVFLSRAPGGRRSWFHVSPDAFQLCAGGYVKHWMSAMQADRLIKTLDQALIKGPDHDTPAHDKDMIGVGVDSENSGAYHDGEEEWWNIAVLKPWGEMQPLTVRTDWRIHQMKELIQALTGVCCQDQQLTYAGNELQSHVNVKTRLRDGCRVNLVLQPCNLARSPSLLQLYIKPLRETPHPVWVNSKHTVQQLKELLHLVVGCCPENQRLMFAGQQLMSEFKLHDYGLKQGYTLHLLLRRQPLA